MEDISSIAIRIAENLREKYYPESVVSSTEKCLYVINDYICFNHVDYCPAVGEEFICSIKNELDSNELIDYNCALYRLNRYKDPCWFPLAFTTHLTEKAHSLSGELQNLFNQYMRHSKIDPSNATNCRKFLYFAQSLGVVMLCQLNLNVMLLYSEIRSKQTDRYNTYLTDMFLYYNEKKLIPFYYTFIYRHLQHQKVLEWNNVDMESRKKIEIASRSIVSHPLRLLEDFICDATQYFKKNGYTKSARTTNVRVIESLLLFLETNKYNYSYEVAKLWSENVRGLAMKASVARRSILLLEEYGRLGHFSPLRHLRPQSRFYDIPEWCKEAAFDYEERKLNEGNAPSTMDMIRSSLTRFCNFLDKCGIHSYWEITAEIIKKFNIEDKHSTPAGKNAFNSRIKKFLFYLGEKGYLSNPMLFMSLATTNAPKETIVVVLTEEEMQQINEALKEGSDVSFREKAILTLGIKMGIRASDIVNLKYNDINWTTESIRFVQKKTEVEVELPMPPEVGNALFRYITEERPQKEDMAIFLSERAPFQQVTRYVCKSALDTALPERDVPGSGFHVTRKTYATNLLKQGVPADTVASALGQVGTTSVHRYLSLDEERMKMCPLDLDDFDIGSW